MNLSMEEHKQMFNIYNNDISKFYSISEHEDYQKNLKKFMLDNFIWNDKTVFEAGIGMGRFLEYYIKVSKQVTATDISENMLNYCRKKYVNYNKKINFLNCKHSNLSNLTIGKFDIFISAYSLSCEIINEENNVLDTYNTIQHGIQNVTNTDSTIIIIELENIFNKLPSFDYKMKEYFSLLNQDYDHIQIDTSYLFNSVNEAYQSINHFFGKEIAEKVKYYNNCIIPEKTGIWYKKHFKL